MCVVQGCSVSDETIESYAMEILPADAAAAFEEHVVLCASCQNRLEEEDLFLHAVRVALQHTVWQRADTTTGCPLVPERREEPRLPCSTLVSVRPRNGCVDGEPFVGRIENISCLGVRIRTCDPIPAGTALKIAGANGACGGVVRHCTPQRGSYWLGIELNRRLSAYAEIPRWLGQNPRQWTTAP